jgi:hypothetical protein
MPIHESCSRSNTSDANFCLFGWRRISLEYPKSHGAGDRPGDNADFLSIDLFEIVKNINFKPRAGDNVHRITGGVVMREQSRKDIHLPGSKGRSRFNAAGDEKLYISDKS